MWPKPDYCFEFSQPPFAWQKVRWLGILLLAMIGVSVVIAWHAAANGQRQLHALEQQKNQRLQTQQKKLAYIVAKPLPAKQAEPQVSAQAQKAVTHIDQLLHIRWFDLLKALESSQSKDIALLQLMPEVAEARFVLSGEAKNYQALLDYLARLQQSPALSKVHLQKHQVNTSHPQQPVIFEIQGGWQP